MKGFIEVRGCFENEDFFKTFFININQIVMFDDYEIFISNNVCPFTCDKTKDQIKELIKQAQ